MSGGISNVSQFLSNFLKKVWYIMAQSLGWDVIVGYALMPAVGETVNGAAFSCPRGAHAITFHVPIMTGVTPTLKLQALDPIDKTTWRDVSVFNDTTGATQPIIYLPQNKVTVIPTAITGSGVLRLVADQDQSSAPINISLCFLLKG
jgi:hypothetical protein